jgi:cobalt-zinc-cadmium resistance protein CzcA
VYTSFLEKANLRFAKGETNILEKTTAETQRGQITIQLNQLKNDIDILQLQFQLLLNTTSIFTPTANNLKIDFTTSFDTSAISKHPTLRILQQQKEISIIKTQLEKSKLLPNLNIGYYNMSMKGTGADNLFYNTSTRFNSVQFGLGLPLFFGSQKATINSNKTLELISENNYQIGLQTLNARYLTVLKQYQTQLQTVKYFEETALQNANIITKTANQQFANGGINYLEWTILINNAVSIQSNYIDAIKDLNQSVIQLNYLTSK